jgi:hypothetical protein
MRQKGPGVWFRYFFDPRQLELFPPEVCREARRWLTEAQRLATAEPYRARVRLISQAFRMTELYSAVVHAGTGLPSGTMAAKAADQTIAAVLAGMEANRRREQHLRFVIDRDPLLKPVIPFDGRANFSPQAASPGTLWQLLVWCAQHGRKDLAGKLIDGLGQGDPSGEMATIAQVMQTLIGQKGKEVTEGERGEGQRNLIQNGTFDALEGPPGDATGVDWKTQGSPPGWSYWERNPGSGRLEWKHSAEGGYVTLTGTKGACFIQTVPVTPGTLYLLVADYRGRVPAGTKASLVVSWKDEKGGWLDEARRVTDLPEGAHRDWTTTCTAGRAPEGAATAIVMLFADEQGAADEVAFDNVRMFAVEGRPQGHGDTEG